MTKKKDGSDESDPYVPPHPDPLPPGERNIKECFYNYIIVV